MHTSDQCNPGVCTPFSRSLTTAAKTYSYPIISHCKLSGAAHRWYMVHGTLCLGSSNPIQPNPLLSSGLRDWLLSLSGSHFHSSLPVCLNLSGWPGFILSCFLRHFVTGLSLAIQFLTQCLFSSNTLFFPIYMHSTSTWVRLHDIIFFFLIRYLLFSLLIFCYVFSVFEFLIV